MRIDRKTDMAGVQQKREVPDTGLVQNIDSLNTKLVPHGCTPQQTLGGEMMKEDASQGKIV